MKKPSPVEFSVRRCTRHQFFVERLKQLGVFDKDSDYAGMLGESVKELSKVFEKQGHSGQSAVLTVQLFTQLMDEWSKKGTFRVRQPLNIR